MRILAVVMIAAAIAGGAPVAVAVLWPERATQHAASMRTAEPTPSITPSIEGPVSPLQHPEIYRDESHGAEVRITGLRECDRPSHNFQEPVQFGAASSPSLVFAADLLASHKLHPFGFQPSLTPHTVPAGTGILIRPESTWQFSDAAFVIAYPEPLRDREYVYPYFVMYADACNIGTLTESLRFLDCCPSIAPTPSGPHGEP